VPERVSYSLGKWQEWGMAHTLRPVTFNAGDELLENAPLTITNPNAGTQTYYTLDGSEPMGNDGVISGTALLYNETNGIVLPTGSYVIVARAYTANNWGPKTAQNLTVRSAAAGKLVISGINYKPQSSGDAEFIMLTNAGNAVLDLSGYAITDAITHTFPQGVVLDIDETLILVKDLNLVPGYTNLQKYKWTKGSLANEGEPISFLNAAGQEVDRVYYLPTAPWPTAANGQGYYLKLNDVNSDNALGENWVAELIEVVSANDALLSGDGVTAIDIVTNEPIQINVYPNPVRSDLNVHLSNVQDVNMTASVYSLSGQVVMERMLTSDLTQINVSSLPKGMYLLKVVDKENGKGTYTVRFIKQ
jgi:hypothetical protein